ncbi:SSI family serine proteinase inhibitor [Streptomyces sp. ISL-11]|uniref:SSI family serine proteinase inhibitor n=1 Tax=Streptomyces sp. ISL-11 TaxID=2819174 RepID=UPI001BE56BCA|nr:SSI family serine proteinase inhibitor [Streptomyces sp. ISL-11]MBT2383707.1 hypothetical protein [Streptomyces sp. ISL-11]
MPFRRLALAAAALAPALLALPTASAAPLPLPERAGDHLTVTVSDSGAFDGTHELYCHPTRGNHPFAKEACAELDGQVRWGQELFAPVPEGSTCTLIYGGPQRAHVTGTWAGQPVKADFNRTNGCEIARWNQFSTLFGKQESSPKG